MTAARMQKEFSGEQNPWGERSVGAGGEDRGLLQTQRLLIRLRAMVCADYLMWLEYRWMRGIRRWQRAGYGIYVYIYDLFLPCALFVR